MGIIKKKVQKIVFNVQMSCLTAKFVIMKLNVNNVFNNLIWDDINKECSCADCYILKNF